MENSSLIDGKYEYYAFISYKDEKEDAEWAKWLQRKLEHYKFPTVIRKKKPELPERVKPIYEYKSEAGGGRLKDVIWKDFTSSKYLIVICSPRSGGDKSKWINNGIRYFIGNGQEENIIPFIVEGKPKAENIDEECFPTALLELKGDRELRGININEVGRDGAAVKVVSRMFDMKFDELWQRYEREKRRKRLLITAFALLLAMISMGVSIGFSQQNRRISAANWKIMENQSRFVAEKAKTLIDTNSYLSSLLAIDILPEDLQNPKRPYTPEAEFVLRQSMTRPMATLVCKASIKSVDACSDGRFVSASADGTIKIWDINTGACLRTLTRHNVAVRCAKFSKDNKYIVSAYGNNTVRIWDAMSGQCIDSLLGHQNQVWYAVFSNEGKKIASASVDRTIKVWDIEKKTCKTYTGHKCQVNSVEYNFNDSLLVSASMDHTIKIWDLSSDSCIMTMTGHTASVRHAIFSPDGKYIASASCDGTIRIWDFTGLCVDTLIGHNSCVNSIKYSHDGKFIVSASDDNTIKIWNTTTKSIQTLEGHFRSVSDVDFSPDSKFIVSCSGDRTIRIWNIAENNSIEYKVSSSPSDCYAQFSSDGKRIVYQVQGGLSGVLDIETGSSIFNTKGTWGYPSFASHGRLLATISNSEDSIKIWDVEANLCKYTITDIGKFSKSLAFSPIGDCIACYSIEDHSIEGCIKIIDIYDSHHKLLLDKSSGYKEKITFSPNGKYVCAQNGSIIRIWNAITGGWVLDYERKQMRGFAFHPFDDFIVIGSGVGLIIEDIETGKEIDILDEYAGFTDWDAQPCFSSDGKYLVSCSEKSIHIRDYKSRICVQNINADAFVSSISINPDGRCIMAGLYDGIIKIWDFPPLQDLIDQTRERFKDRPLTAEERRMYYLE